MKLLRKIIKAWYFPWLIIGVILRLFISAITAHPDLWALFFAQHLLVFKGVFNIYDYLAYLPRSSDLAVNYGTNFFTYPPLAYFTLGSFGLILKPILSLENFSWIVTNYPQIYQNLEIYKTLLLFKLPYLFFDLAIAFLLVDFFDDPKKKKWAFLLWIFNPLSFYTSFMVGQFDVIPLFFSVLALRLALRNKSGLAALSLGIGGALKMFPFFFLPFLVLILGKNYWEKAKLSVFGILPYFLSTLPFISSPAFRQVSLFSAQSQKMLHMILPVSGAEGIYIFVFLFSVLIILAGYNPNRTKSLWWYFLGVMFLFFSVTHYHPQWFLWLTPLLVMEMVKNRFAYLWLDIILFASWLFITLTFEPSLNFGLFAPLKPELLNLSGVFEGIRFYDIFQLKSIVRSLFAASSLGLIYFSYRRGYEKS